MLRRAAPIAATVVAVLALTAGRSWAGEPTPAPGCDEVARTQIYVGWGPSLHYDRVVTVSYSVGECTASFDSDTKVYAIDAAGTATVYDGEAAAGQPIDSQAFSLSASWADPADEGYPPSWWSCGVQSAELSWEIHGVYSFTASATDGEWSLTVTAGGQSVGWSGCA